MLELSVMSLQLERASIGGLKKPDLVIYKDL